MITQAYLERMARYNRWQNASIFGAAEMLDEAARQADRGAFFASIHRTLSHLLWGDTAWMGRFQAREGPEVPIAESGDWVADWGDLTSRRRVMDARILDWAKAATAADVEGDLTWSSGTTGRVMTLPKAVCIIQLFNHQAHHRGQVHAMLTAAGARPDVTDLPFMPEDA